MVTSLLQSFKNNSIGSLVFDQLSYSDSSLPFGNILSADRVREMFAERNSRSLAMGKTISGIRD
jgi:hypothetical protein